MAAAALSSNDFILTFNPDSTVPLKSCLEFHTQQQSICGALVALCLSAWLVSQFMLVKMKMIKWPQ